MPQLILKQITASVRRLLQDDQYDGPTIVEAANWVIYDLCNNTRLRVMEASQELEASAGDTFLAFPDDMMSWTSIYSTSPSVSDLTPGYLGYGEFMRRYPNFASATAGQLRIWTDYGNGMRFAAPLSVDHVFQFDYLREPVEMKRDGDICELPGRYAELINRLTKARVLEIEEDYESAEFERGLVDNQKTAFIRNEGRGGSKIGPTIIRTNRRRREQ